jgi:hypothetical protein
MSAAGVLLALVLAARQLPAEPDFSGRWRLFSAEGPEAAAAELVVEQSLTRTNVSGEPMRPYYSGLRVERHFEDGVRTATYHIGLTGGAVGGIVAGEPADAPKTRSSVSVLWRDRTLVIRRESRVEREHVTQSYTSHEEAWSMDSAGRLVIVTVLRASEAAAKQSTATYTPVRR